MSLISLSFYICSAGKMHHYLCCLNPPTIHALGYEDTKHHYYTNSFVQRLSNALRGGWPSCLPWLLEVG